IARRGDLCRYSCAPSLKVYNGREILWARTWSGCSSDSTQLSQTRKRSCRRRKPPGGIDRAWKPTPSILKPRSPCLPLRQKGIPRESGRKESVMTKRRPEPSSKKEKPLPPKPSRERDFKTPVAWLLGRQLIASLKGVVLLAIYGGKLDPRDWMRANVFTVKGT